jgi:hypothetical protein
LPDCQSYFWLEWASSSKLPQCVVPAARSSSMLHVSWVSALALCGNTTVWVAVFTPCL